MVRKLIKKESLKMMEDLKVRKHIKNTGKSKREQAVERSQDNPYQKMPVISLIDNKVAWS